MKCTREDFKKLRKYLKEFCNGYTPLPQVEFHTDNIFLTGHLTGMCIELGKITLILNGNVIVIKREFRNTPTYVTSK